MIFHLKKKVTSSTQIKNGLPVVVVHSVAGTNPFTTFEEAEREAYAWVGQNKATHLAFIYMWTSRKVCVAYVKGVEHHTYRTVMTTFVRYNVHNLYRYKKSLNRLLEKVEIG